MQDLSRGGPARPPQQPPSIQRAAAAFVIVAACVPVTELLAVHLRAAFAQADTASPDRLPAKTQNQPVFGPAITMDALPEGSYIGRDSGGNPVLILGGRPGDCKQVLPCDGAAPVPRPQGEAIAARRKSAVKQPDETRPVVAGVNIPEVKRPAAKPKRDEVAALPPHETVPLSRSDIQIPVSGLRFSQTGVSFTVDAGGVNTLQFLGATTGHLFDGAANPGRKCPVVPIAKGQYTEQEDGALHHFTVRLDPATVRLIREYRCSFHPKIRF